MSDSRRGQMQSETRPDTTREWLAQRAKEQPDAPAILSLDRALLSYGGLQALVSRVGDQLRAAGYSPQDRIALVLPNGPTMATACLSVSAAVSCVPLNPDYTETEMRGLFELLRVDALITSSKVSPASRNAAVGLRLAIFEVTAGPNSEAGMFSLLEAVQAGDPSGAPGAERRISHPNVKPTPNRNPSRENGAARPNDSLDEIAFVLHTSGSTSRPKVVPLSHRNLLASADNVADSLELGPTDCCVHMLPLFHVGALVDLLLAPLSRGGAVVCCEEISSQLFFEALDRFKPSWFQGVPTMLRDLRDRARDLDRAGGGNSLRLIRSVSASLPRALLEEIEATLATPVIEIYGMTETSGLITSNSLSSEERQAGSVGRASGPRVAIMDEAGMLLGAGFAGEVVVRGETVMSGYESAESDMSDCFVGPWFKTGDVGRLDTEGQLFLSGRIKEIINRGGEKISPGEIDEVASLYPNVFEAAAFAIPHLSLGEEVALAVVPRSREGVDAAGLLRFLSERLAAFKVPRAVYTLDAMPRGGSGKLQRHRLAEVSGALSASIVRPHWIEPKGDLARRIAGMWQRALSVPNVGLMDNFFDLGGDSLKAAGLVAELEADRGEPVPLTALVGAPTLGEFVECVSNLCAKEPGTSVSGPEETPEGIPSDLYRGLVGFLSAWHGERPHPESLLVGRNTRGTRPPLFWGLQAFSEFESLADHLDPDQPVYGLRSLYLTKRRGPEANRELASYYVREIRRLSPSGPYWLGGFCEGGKIAFEIARQLREEGKEVALLCLQEQFVAEDYEGRVAFFFCAPGKHSPYRYYRNPERGWSKFYSGPVALYRSPHQHDDYYLRGKGLESFAVQLSGAIEDVRQGRISDPLQIGSAPQQLSTAPHFPIPPHLPGLQRLPPEAYDARIRFRPPRFLRPGESRVLRVEIENRSSVVWAPTSKSGILLGNRWRNLRGKHKVWIDGVIELSNPVSPGDRVELPLMVRAPDWGVAWTLDVDLVDEGIGWFGDFGSKPALRRVYLKRWRARQAPS